MKAVAISILVMLRLIFTLALVERARCLVSFVLLVLAVLDTDDKTGTVAFRDKKTPFLIENECSVLLARAGKTIGLAIFKTD